MTPPAAPRPALPLTALAPPYPLAPLGGAVVESERASFTWKSVPGATRYTLQIASDRQFTTDVVEVDAGVSTELALQDALAPSGTPHFWRVRAEAPSGASRWSPYGRFVAGSDADADAFRVRHDAERLAAARDAARRRVEEAAARDLVPFIERDDTIASDRETGALGVTMVLSFVLVLLAILAATTLM